MKEKRVEDILAYAAVILAAFTAAAVFLKLEYRDINLIYENNTYECNIFSDKDKKHKNIKININKAEKDELCMIDGISENAAEGIISYRERHGSFKRPEDLIKVREVGRARYSIIKDFVCTE